MCIRKVPGATRPVLYWLHLRTFIKLLCIACLVAWPLIGYLSGVWLDNFAYRIDVTWLYYLLPALAAFGLLAITAGYHGWQNGRVNLVETLKLEG